MTKTNEELIKDKFGDDTPYIWTRIKEELLELMEKAREEGENKGREDMLNETQKALDSVEIRCGHCKKLINADTIEYRLLRKKIFPKSD